MHLVLYIYITIIKMTETNSKILSKFFPENLERNKLINHFNENLEANLKELYTNSEIQSVCSSIDEFRDILNKNGFLEKQDSETIKLRISESLQIFTLVNLQLNISDKEIRGKFDYLDDRVRINKSGIYWLVCSEDESINKKFEADLLKDHKDLTGSDDKIKFDKESHKAIREKLIKQVQHYQYSRESLGLNSNQNGDNKMSWRKKSGDVDDFKKGSKLSTNTNSKNTNFGRERYNSDVRATKNVYRPSIKKEEIEIDLGKIHYSLKIKNKYSFNELFLNFDKYRITKTFDTRPKFLNDIEEVCSNEKRKEFNFLKKERSMTYSLPGNKFDEVKLNLNAPEFKLPEKNPISMGKLSGIQINKQNA